MNLGVALQAQDMTDEATDAFEQAVSAWPIRAQGAAKVARLYWTNQRPKQALRWAQEALADDPDLADARGIAGQAYLAIGRHDEAVKSLTAYLEHPPHLPARQLADAHSQLAQALRMANRQPQAVAQLHQAIEIDPTYWEAHRALAMLLVVSQDPAVRDPAAAIRHAERAMALTDQHEPIVLITLAAAYAENGLFDLAVEATDLALAAEGRPLRPAEVATLRSHRRLYVEGIALSQRPGRP